MRHSLLILLLFPLLAPAQFTDAEKKATLAFVAGLYDPATGAFRNDAKSPPSLRATSLGVRVFTFLGAKQPDAEKTRSFVFARMDPIAGGWAEPRGDASAAMTAIGLVAVNEFGFTPDTYPRSLAYLKAHAKSFEDVRIGAAAVELMKKKPAWLDDWIKVADAQLNNDGTAGKGDGLARDTASVAAMKLRLGYPVANKAKVIEAIQKGQRPDGGWGKADAEGSDLESTYRVMRALMLFKEKPKDTTKLTAFLTKCRDKDGGYSVEPGAAATMSGTYYAVSVMKWMNK